MTTYNTMNSVPSADARDRYDNSQVFDELMNGSAPKTHDRLGVLRQSWSGMEQSFQDFLDGSGWSSLGAYGVGIQIVSHTQTVDYQGQPYQLKSTVPASINDPYITTGNWAVEGVNFKLVGDNLIRQDLAGPSGAGMVGLVSGGNLAQAVTYVTPTMFGAVNDGAADDFAAIMSAADYAGQNKVELWLSGSYAISAGLDFSAVRKIRCFNDARIVPLMDSGVAVRWVASSGILIEKPVQEGDLFVEWPTRDWTKDRTSFLTQNIYNGTFNLSSAKATRALLMKGLERGCVYNNVNIGVFSNNLVGVWLSSGSAAGWCNANLIHGGRYYGASGTGTGQTVAGSLYPSQAGHIFVETTPYACNGNKFVNPSLEWIGPSFKLARMGGLSNTLSPSYCELRGGDVSWITDVGTNNNFELMGIPSISGGYDPDLAPSANRVDVSGAIDPKVSGSNGYVDGTVRQVVRTRNGARPAMVAINTGAGAALEARNTSSASNPSLVIAGPDGSTGVSIAAAGTWKVFGGTKSLSWSSGIAPTAGAWARGDLVFFTNPSAGGFIGAVCVAAGTPGTWKNFGAISA